MPWFAATFIKEEEEQAKGRCQADAFIIDTAKRKRKIIYDGEPGLCMYKYGIGSAGHNHQ
jgi:hypothetical protein